MNLTPRYDIGSPVLKDLWIDPVHGCDENDGTSRAQALKTLGAAWKKLPSQTNAHGWRLLLCPGVHGAETIGQIALNDVRGTKSAPILLQSVESNSPARLPQLDFNRCSHLYLLDLELSSPQLNTVPISTDNVLHFADCEYTLVRGVKARGVNGSGGLPRLAFKANQCTYMYIEDSEFSDSYAYIFAYVAVQYGHIVRCKFARGGMSGVCLKGGSAYHLVAGNEVSHSRHVGINAGEGTGFAYMVPPWLHYEAYDIKIVNNVVHHAGGGIGVGGGYNILAAHNTCYQVGTNRDLVVVAFGGRGWVGDGHAAVCEKFHQSGGWCNRGAEGCFIPNRNLSIYNNLFLNPDGFESECAHFGVTGPAPAAPGSNVPDPVAVTNIRIENNLVWNGGPQKAVLDDVEKCWGLAARPTLDAAELARLNTLNKLKPVLLDPENGNYAPSPEASAHLLKAVPIPDFDPADPLQPPCPLGDLSNAVPLDRSGQDFRGGFVGAYGR